MTQISVDDGPIWPLALALAGNVVLSSVTKEKEARKRRRDGTVPGLSLIGALSSRRRGLVFDFFFGPTFKFDYSSVI